MEYEEFHQVRYSCAAPGAAVDLSVLPADRRLPDKAIDLRTRRKWRGIWPARLLRACASHPGRGLF
ncbi:MAG: hypothetical protein H6746_08065 [Deltaproteobacteria bacterium]|nr:hypothetical protein [Deltaproteobacteria bacterium]